MSYVTTVKAQGTSAAQHTTANSSSTTSPTVTLTQRQGKLQATLDGQTFTLDWQHINPLATQTLPANGGRYSLLIAGTSYEVFVRHLPQDDEQSSRIYEVQWADQSFTVTVADEHTRLLEGLVRGGTASGAANIKIQAPMPGLVTQTLVAVGDTVKAGQTVIILEAMKMENDLAAPIAGTIKELKVNKGDTVDHGQLLVTIEHSDQP
jgi:Biotin carboxyl carrier protein